MHCLGRHGVRTYSRHFLSSVMERLSHHIKLQPSVAHTITIHPEIWNHLSNIMHQDTNGPPHRSSPKGALNCSTTTGSKSQRECVHSPSVSGTHPQFIPAMVIIKLDSESQRDCLGYSRQPLVQMPEIFPACIANTPPPGFACSRNFCRNAYASALSVPVIFRRNGPEEIRQPDNEHVHLARGDAPSQSPGLLRCQQLSRSAALQRCHVLNGPWQMQKTSWQSRSPTTMSDFILNSKIKAALGNNVT